MYSETGIKNPRERPFTIKVIDSDEINAMALPGGYFYVNSGLILAADNESELAGVMAHEIAHVAAHHAARQMTRAEYMQLSTVPLIFSSSSLAIDSKTLVRFGGSGGFDDGRYPVARQGLLSCEPVRGGRSHGLLDEVDASCTRISLPE